MADKTNDVPVTQADIDAVANAFKELAFVQSGEEATEVWREAFARHRLTRQPTPGDLVEEVRQAVAEYREAPFRSADWLTNRLMTIFENNQTKGGSPWSATAARTFNPPTGVGRDVANENTLVLYFTDRPTNEEMQSVMDALSAQQRQGEPVDLHPATTALVARFSRSLAEKLSASERKYGWSDDWTKDDWQDECQSALIKHVAKGDPLDVAAFAAFMWHHGWPTAPQPDRDGVLRGAIKRAMQMLQDMGETEEGVTRAYRTLAEAINAA